MTEFEVRNIRLRWAKHLEGEAPTSVRDLAFEHKVGRETIRRILRWETWAWLAEEGPGAPAKDWAAGAEESRKKLHEKMRAEGLLEELSTGKGEE